MSTYGTVYVCVVCVRICLSVEDKLWELILSLHHGLLGLDSGSQAWLVLLPTELAQRPGIYSGFFTRIQ